MNTSLPTDPQLRVTDSLIEELRREKTFESPEGEAHRQVVLRVPIYEPTAQLTGHLRHQNSSN